MPNPVAYLMIFMWPLVSILLYRRLNILPATFITIVGGYMILPVGTSIDFPMIPALDKESVSSISALLGCIFIKKIKINLVPKQGIEKWLVYIYLILPFLTFITNSEPVFDGRFWRPSLTLYNAISTILTHYITLIPFILGLQIIKNYDEQLLLFKYLTIAGLCYSLPILFEIRMSPQLHTWIYGYFPHSFTQQIRGEGFRAAVFMGHGLLVATFVLIAVASATILWKKRINTFGIPAFITVFYLMMVLLLQKTYTAYLLALILILAIVWLKTTLIDNLSRILILLVITYPISTLFKIFPQQEIVEFISILDIDRASSLAFRFYHENILLEHARDKFLFGWGGWNRNLPWGTIPDGYWIIVLGKSGIIGFICTFGLAMNAIIKGVKANQKLVTKTEKILLSASIILIAVIMIDQIPNSSMHSGYIWLLIGLLLGRANHILNKTKLVNSPIHTQSLITR